MELGLRLKVYLAGTGAGRLMGMSVVCTCSVCVCKLTRLNGPVVLTLQDLCLKEVHCVSF